MNNNCSTDFYNECMRDDYPYKVIWNYYQPVFYKDGFSRIYYSQSTCGPVEEIEPIESRFDVLDISPKKIKYGGLTMEKIQRRLNKIKEEINSNPIWKDPEPKYIRPSFSEDNLRKLIEEDFKRCLEESVRKFIEKTQITNRFEILDL